MLIKFERTIENEKEIYVIDTKAYELKILTINNKFSNLIATSKYSDKQQLVIASSLNENYLEELMNFILLDSHTDKIFKMKDIEEYVKDGMEA